MRTDLEAQCEAGIVSDNVTFDGQSALVYWASLRLAWGIGAMKVPTSCHLWSCEALKREDLHNFDTVEVFVDESHLVRSLVRCPSCGRLYFKEWLEFIGYLSGVGEDPQYVTLIPVETRDEIEQLQQATSTELTQFTPQLRSDWPSDADKPRIYWVRGDT